MIFPYDFLFDLFISFVNLSFICFCIDSFFFNSSFSFTKSIPRFLLILLLSTFIVFKSLISLILLDFPLILILSILVDKSLLVFILLSNILFLSFIFEILFFVFFLVGVNGEGVRLGLIFDDVEFKTFLVIICSDLISSKIFNCKDSIDLTFVDIVFLRRNNFSTLEVASEYFFFSKFPVIKFKLEFKSLMFDVKFFSFNFD